MSNRKPASAKPNQSNSSGLAWRDAQYQRFYEVVDQLVAELQEHVWVKTGKAKRRVLGDGLDKLTYSVECLVRDCVAVVLQRHRKGEASIKRGQYSYPASRPDKRLTYGIHVERAFNGLIEIGYLCITKEGFHDRKGRKDGTPTSRLTRYVATDRLFSLFADEELRVLPVIVPQYKDPELIKIRVKEPDAAGVIRKRSLTVLETNDTKRMQANLRRINKALPLNWYDLEIPNEELTDLQRRLADDPVDERTIRMDQRSLHRVFNDAELQTGGRFYGGWWQNIPKEYRHHLAVNGKKMVELDYSNQHPSILYAQAAEIRPADCYADVVPSSSLPQDVTKKELRSAVKAAFNAMLNSPRPLRQPPKGVRPSQFGLTWREFSEAIIAFHEPIAHHFYTGVGLRLQRLDSDIAEKVMLHFVEHNIAVLPLHDSFLMHHGYESSLQPVMMQAFEDVVGVSPVIDRKEPKLIQADFSNHDEDDLGPPVTDDIHELLGSLCGHDHRRNAFFALRNKKQNIRHKKSNG